AAGARPASRPGAGKAPLAALPGIPLAVLPAAAPGVLLAPLAAVLGALRSQAAGPRTRTGPTSHATAGTPRSQPELIRRGCRFHVAQTAWWRHPRLMDWCWRDICYESPILPVRDGGGRVSS